MLKRKDFILIFIPAILIVALALFIRIIQYQPINKKVSKSETEKTEQEKILIPIFSDDPIVGNKKAPITIITFEDFGCPACKQQNTVLNELSDKYPEKIKIIWKGLPVSQFPYDTKETQKMAYCANEQGKFKEFKEMAFNNNDNLSPTVISQMAKDIKLDEKKLDNCLTSGKSENYISKVEQLARTFNVQTVPTFFVDNKQVEPKTLEQWKIQLKLED